jgi:hypothetical protein
VENEQQKKLATGKVQPKVSNFCLPLQIQMLKSHFLPAIMGMSRRNTKSGKLWEKVKNVKLLIKRNELDREKS